MDKEKEFSENRSLDENKGDGDMTTLTQRLNSNSLLKKYNNLKLSHEYIPSEDDSKSFKKVFDEIIQPLNLDVLSKILNDNKEQ